MRYYLLNEIYVEYDPYAENFFHWNPVTRIGKKDKVSRYVVDKLIKNKLKPILTEDFMEMFDHVSWLKTPKIEYVSVFGEVRLEG